MNPSIEKKNLPPPLENPRAGICLNCLIFKLAFFIEMKIAGANHGDRLR